MNKLSQLFSNEIVHAAGWTIIHSLWQCTLIALVIAISYAFTKKAHAATRYWINTLGLLTCVITSAITFYMNFKSSVQIEIIGDLAINSMQPTHQTVYAQTISEIINQHIHQIVFCWIIGFGLYITKYLADYFYCQHIKHHNNKAPNETMQQMFNELKNCLGISDKIQLRISEAVHIPCVIGHFSPVVLLPASLLLGLSTQQIKVILLHELGHVSRRDYLISSIQTLITSLYFFNPFTRWISSKIDEERENACDDIAVFVSGDPLFYAHTLKEFAEMKNNYSPTIAITGKSNLLINRIKRLFIRDNSFSKTYGKAITIMTLALLGIGFSVSGHSNEEKKEESFQLKLEKEPLSMLLKLSQDFCPNLSKNITLKHGNQLISAEFTSLKCEAVEYVIKNMDDGLGNTLTKIPFNEKDISLKELVQKIEAKCPALTGKIHPNNPNKIVGLETPDLSCSIIEQTITTMDRDNEPSFVSLPPPEIQDIKYSNVPFDEYNQAIKFDPPSEAIEKGYSTDCNMHYSVDKKGKAFDISIKCTEGSEEAKAFFGKYMATSLEETQFPIKAENEQAIAVLDREFRVKWTMLNPPTDSTAAKSN